MTKHFSSSCALDSIAERKDSNYFTPLPAVEDDFDPSEVASVPPPPGKTALEPGLDDEEDEFMIDPLDEAMIFLEYASEMDALLSDVKKIWERVANDKCTLMYAGLYTKCSIDMALYLTEKVVEDLGIEDFQWLCDIHVDILTNFDPDQLNDMRCTIKYSQFTKEGAFFESVMEPCDKLLEGLPSLSPRSKKMLVPKSYIPWQTARWPDTPTPDAVRRSRNPMTLIQYVMSMNAAADQVNAQRSRAALLIIEDMEHYRRDVLRTSKKSSVDSMERLELGLNDFQMRPLLSGLEALVAQKGSTFTNFKADFNIWMSFLSESYNSYVWAGTAAPTNKNARLQLVQHYKEIATAVKQVIQIVETEPEWNRFKNLVPFSKELERLAGLPRWDLYSQAPLVNGLAMLEISFQSMCLGVNIWNDDGMAGFVLHGYNLVMQRKVLKRPIPIMEKPCSMLLNAVFMGRRPTSNFRSSLFRFLGAKVEKVRGHRGRENMPPRPDFHADIGKSHVIGDPKHLPQAWGKDRRIKPEDLSKVYNMHSRDFHMYAGWPKDREAVGAVFGRKSKKAKRSINNEPGKRIWGPNDDRPSDHDFDEEDWTMHAGRNMMRLVNDNLRDEINILDDDAFPLTRVNAFAVYVLLHDILRRVAQKAEQDFASTNDQAKFEMLRQATFPRAAGVAGAMISTMMDFVDGEGKSEVKMKGRDGRKMIFFTDSSVMLNWVAEALVEATEGKDLPEHYMWKHV